MAIIRPSSDLRNRYNELSELCHQHSEPVFITKNGTGDLVLLSNEQYEHLCGKQDLYRLLEEGLLAMRSQTGLPAPDVFAALEKELGLDGI